MMLKSCVFVSSPGVAIKVASAVGHHEIKAEIALKGALYLSNFCFLFLCMIYHVLLFSISISFRDLVNIHMKGKVGDWCISRTNKMVPPGSVFNTMCDF